MLADILLQMEIKASYQIVKTAMDNFKKYSQLVPVAIH